MLLVHRGLLCRKLCRHIRRMPTTIRGERNIIWKVNLRPAEVGGVAKDGRVTFPPPPTSGREIFARLVATVHVQLAPWKAARIFTNTGTPVNHDTRPGTRVRTRTLTLSYGDVTARFLILDRSWQWLWSLDLSEKYLWSFDPILIPVANASTGGA